MLSLWHVFSLPWGLIPPGHAPNTFPGQTHLKWLLSTRLFNYYPKFLTIGESWVVNRKPCLGFSPNSLRNSDSHTWDRYSSPSKSGQPLLFWTMVSDSGADLHEQNRWHREALVESNRDGERLRLTDPWSHSLGGPLLQYLPQGASAS